MLCVLPIALFTEREVVTGQAVVSESASVDGLVALVAAEPRVVSLLGLHLLNLLLDALAQFVLEFLLLFILLSLNDFISR
jgi:hypothetical protein